MMLHQRSYIRYGLLWLLRENIALANALCKSIYANRVDAWQRQELPALGLYATSDAVEDRQQGVHRLGLEIELYVMGVADLDDDLDGLCAEVEAAFNLNALETELDAVGFVNSIRDGRLVSTTIYTEGDTLEEVAGVAVLEFEILYYERRPPKELNPFAIAYGRWNMAGIWPEPVHMESLAELEQD